MFPQAMDHLPNAKWSFSGVVPTHSPGPWGFYQVQGLTCLIPESWTFKKWWSTGVGKCPNVSHPSTIGDIISNRYGNLWEGDVKQIQPKKHWKPKCVAIECSSFMVDLRDNRSSCLLHLQIVQKISLHFANWNLDPKAWFLHPSILGAFNIYFNSSHWESEPPRTASEATYILFKAKLSVSRPATCATSPSHLPRPGSARCSHFSKRLFWLLLHAVTSPCFIWCSTFHLGVSKNRGTPSHHPFSWGFSL